MESEKNSRNNSKENLINKKNIINFAYLRDEKINLFLTKNTPSVSKSNSKKKYIEYIDKISKLTQNKIKEKEKTKAKNEKTQLVDLEKMFYQIHRKDVAKLIYNTNKLKRQLEALKNKPNNMITVKDKAIKEYFDLSKLKEKNLMFEKTYKKNKIKENLKNKVLKNNITSKVKEYVEMSENKEIEKHVDEKLLDRELLKMTLKNRSISTIIDEHIQDKISKKYSTISKSERKINSLSVKVPTINKFDTLVSNKLGDNSFILDEEKLIKLKRKSHDKNPNYSSDHWLKVKYKDNTEKETRISTPNDKITPTLTIRESFFNNKSLKMTPHNFGNNLEKHLTERAYNLLKIPNSHNNSVHDSPDLKQIKIQIPKIQLEKINIDNLNSKISHTERKINNKRKPNSELNVHKLKTLNYLSDATRNLNYSNISKKFDFNLSATCRDSTKRNLNFKEDENEILRLNKYYLKKYKKIIDKGELQKKKHRINEVWKENEIDLIVRSSSIIEIEKLKHEYIFQHNIAQLTKLEKLKKFEEFEKTKTMKFINSMLNVNNTLPKEPSTLTIDIVKTNSKVDVNDRKKRLKNKLLHTFGRQKFYGN